MSLLEYQLKFRRLKVNVNGDGRPSPHKICMLLALLDMARAGGLAVNRIEFGPAILERYARYFEAVKGPNDHPNPYFPFFHLGGELKGKAPSFWHLKPIPGREAVLEAMRAARSYTDIANNVEYAFLDAGLFDLLQQPLAIDALSEALAREWFDTGLSDLARVAADCEKVSRYESQIRGALHVASGERVPYQVRDPAFRRVVTQIYDYRCAATGVRIILPSGEAMVEAAHIHPFAEAGDDDPRNGLALTPDMHWAMDKNLIAPGPDLKWHVSAALDDRVPDFAAFVRLAGRELFRPAEARYTPKLDVLEWRRQRLRPG